MIEPVREVLTRSLPHDTLDVDRRWARQLVRQVRSAPVELVAEFAELRTTVDGVMRMRVGDVLPIASPRDVIAKVDGMPLIGCDHGISNHRYALRVQQMLSAAA